MQLKLAGDKNCHKSGAQCYLGFKNHPEVEVTKKLIPEQKEEIYCLSEEFQSDLTSEVWKTTINEIRVEDGRGAMQEYKKETSVRPG